MPLTAEGGRLSTDSNILLGDATLLNFMIWGGLLTISIPAWKIRNKSHFAQKSVKEKTVAHHHLFLEHSLRAKQDCTRTAYTAAVIAIHCGREGA